MAATPIATATFAYCSKCLEFQPPELESGITWETMKGAYLLSYDGRFIPVKRHSGQFQVLAFPTGFKLQRLDSMLWKHKDCQSDSKTSEVP